MSNKTTFWAVLLVTKDVVIAIFNVLLFCTVLILILSSGIYLMLMFLVTLINGRLITISEYDYSGAKAILYETCFFYIALSCWVVAGLVFFSDAVRKKRAQFLLRVK